MTQDEVQAAVAGLGRVEQIIYAEASNNQFVTAPSLREPTGQNHGMTRQLDTLLKLGLIYRLGKATKKDAPVGIRPMRYALTPLADVEMRRAKEEARPATRPQRRVPRIRIATLRQREKGDWTNWYQMRRRVIEEARALNYSFLQAIDWEATPEDEIFEVAEELADLRDAIAETMARIEARQMDDATRAKIQKMLGNTNGRSQSEIEIAKRLAANLEKKLGA